MGLLDRFGEAEGHNYTKSQAELEAFHVGSLETMESGAELLDALAEGFANHCSLTESEAAVNDLLNAVGGPPEQLVEFLDKASLIGSPSAEDPVLKAKVGVATARADLVRTWLLMRLRRDYVFGLADLLRLRLTPAIGYLRLQSETVGLLALFTEDKQLAWKWFNVVKGGGKEFYRRVQPRLKAKLRSLGLAKYYDEGSEWALHSTVFGIAGGVTTAPDRGPGTVSISYQELGRDTDGLFTWVWHYLNAHRLFALALITEVPELKEATYATEKCKAFAEELSTWTDRKRRREELKGRY